MIISIYGQLSLFDCPWSFGNPLLISLLSFSPAKARWLFLFLCVAHQLSGSRVAQLIAISAGCAVLYLLTAFIPLPVALHCHYIRPSAHAQARSLLRLPTPNHPTIPKQCHVQNPPFGTCHELTVASVKPRSCVVVSREQQVCLAQRHLPQSPFSPSGDHECCQPPTFVTHFTTRKRVGSHRSTGGFYHLTCDTPCLSSMPQVSNNTSSPIYIYTTRDSRPLWMSTATKFRSRPSTTTDKITRHKGRGGKGQRFENFSFTTRSLLPSPVERCRRCAVAEPMYLYILRTGSLIFGSPYRALDHADRQKFLGSFRRFSSHEQRVDMAMSVSLGSGRGGPPHARQAGLGFGNIFLCLCLVVLFGARPAAAQDEQVVTLQNLTDCSVSWSPRAFSSITLVTYATTPTHPCKKAQPFLLLCTTEASKHIH